MTTGLVHDERFLSHDTGPGHPERPERVTAAIEQLRGEAWFEDIVNVEARSVDPAQLESVHRGDYVRRAAEACAAEQPFLDSMDVAISRASFDVALLAAGGTLALADAIVDGRIDNGFALVRPPGHHAEAGTALGFCLFNNVAVLARHLQREHGMDKIAILDWDVHHGNGTQHLFESDPSVMYLSTHQYPFYPGTGAASETGEGRGRGTVVNCPMPAGATDTAFEIAFQDQLLPALMAYRPECLIVSAGFDAHRDDPLAQLNLSTGCFGWMTDRALEIADQCCDGRLISVLEGGYHLDRLGECVSLHVDRLRLAGG